MPTTNLPEDFKIDELTEEIVIHRVEGAADPFGEAANVVKSTLSASLKSSRIGTRHFPVAVRHACRGAMAAFLVCRHDPSQGAVALIDGVLELAYAEDLDATLALHGALEGVADLQP